MRLFVGVPVPGEIKTKLIDLQKKLQESGTDLKFIERENFHFTVKFLGEVSEGKLDLIKRVLLVVSNKHTQFRVFVKGIGVFPNEKFIRVVWVGVTNGSEKFKDMIHEIQDGLETIHPEDHDKIKVHLTVARTKSTKNFDKLVRLIKIIGDAEVGDMVVDRIVLYQSKPSPKGPVYSIQDEYMLKKPKAL